MPLKAKMPQIIESEEDLDIVSKKIDEYLRLTTLLVVKFAKEESFSSKEDERCLLVYLSYFDNNYKKSCSSHQAEEILVIVHTLATKFMLMNRNAPACRLCITLATKMKAYMRDNEISTQQNSIEQHSVPVSEDFKVEAGNPIRTPQMAAAESSKIEFRVSSKLTLNLERIDSSNTESAQLSMMQLPTKTKTF